MNNDLTNQKIKDTYGRLIQYVSSSFYDLLGNEISGLNFSGSINIYGNIKTKYLIISSSYTIQEDDSNLEIIQSGTTQSLPSAQGNLGMEISLINCSTGSVMILASGSEGIGNELTPTTSSLTIFREDAPRLISNNVCWRIK